jgi:hypothetical protein
MSTSSTERAADYHADHGPDITLSSSIASTLVLKTPAHAWAQHPKLNPDYRPVVSDAFDMGTAIHQLLLRDDRVDVANYRDYKTTEAKEWRDAVRAEGRVPMLNHRWLEAQEIANSVRQQIAELNVEPVMFTEGQAEHTIRFTASGAKCRAMLDWLRDDRLHVDDFKTTVDARPTKCERHIFNYGYDIRAAFYVRAVEAEYGVTPGFRWLFVEKTPPYPVSVVTLSPEAMDLAHHKVEGAISIWNECLEKNEWPAYSRDLHTADLPPWLKDQWAEVDADESIPF